MCMYKGKQVHFFGFRGYEYVSAIRVWGQPDFIHPVHDRRAYIEYDPINDIGIFCKPKKLNKLYTVTDVNMPI